MKLNGLTVPAAAIGVLVATIFWAGFLWNRMASMEARIDQLPPTYLLDDVRNLENRLDRIQTLLYQRTGQRWRSDQQLDYARGVEERLKELENAKSMGDGGQ